MPFIDGRYIRDFDRAVTVGDLKINVTYYYEDNMVCTIDSARPIPDDAEVTLTDEQREAIETYIQDKHYDDDMGEWRGDWD